ncbi:MAG: HesA/MoeB/ThiF family protein [Deltaproteobacteria bacterium]|nr:HesA/MoeB/ThiF family protein [Deltaproteobacteria bacterium]
MSDKIQTDILERIQLSAVMIKDPAGRNVQILEDDKALRIADECCCSAHQVYTEALRAGIYPYRYLRNRDVISVREQFKLANSCVAVVGLGGLGGQVVLLLTRMGVGHLVVIDNDVFDETNLNRQALSSNKSIGRPKSEEAVDVVASINPGVTVTPYQMRLDASNARKMLDASDVVVDALDNIADRFVLESETKKLGVPLVHGALAGFEGQIMTIFPDDPGLKHLYGDEKVEKNDPKRPEAILGVPTITPSIISSLQAMEVLKIILKRGKIFRNIMVHVDLEGGQVNQFVFECEDSSKKR